MSDKPESTADQNSRRVNQWRKKLKSAIESTDLAEIAYKDSRLSIDEFNDSVFPIGYKLVIRVLEREACAGDTKACDLFLKYATAYFDRPRTKQKDNDPRVKAVSAFIQQARNSEAPPIGSGQHDDYVESAAKSNRINTDSAT